MSSEITPKNQTDFTDIEAPAVEAPNVEDPQTENTSAEAPNVEVPQTENTSAEAQETEAPLTDAPEATSKCSRCKIKERLLQESQVYQAIIHSTREAIVLLDENGQIKLWSEIATDLFGFLEEEVLGNDIYETIAPDYSMQSSRLVRRIQTFDVANSPKRMTISLEATTKFGHKFPIELALSTLRRKETGKEKEHKSDNESENYILASFRDLTATKQTEAHLKQWQEIFDCADWGIVTSDGTKMKYGMVNPAYARMHGYTVQEMIGRSVQDDYPTDAFIDLREQIRNANQTGQHSFESMHLRKDGTTFPVHVDITVVKDANNEPLYRIVNVVDITERKKAEASVRENERLAAIGEFAAGVAHDFNNALQTIIGGIEMALQDAAMQPGSIEALNVSIRMALDAAARIKQLQRFSGRSSETVPIETLDIKTVFEDTVLHTKSLLRESQLTFGKKIKFTLSFQDNLTIMGNPGELRSAMFNLLKNSIEAMPFGGHIRISARKEEENIVIDIADSGVGMDEETRKRVFQPFFSTKGLEQGRGLGMSGVHAIISSHKGQIIVKDTVLGEGTTFEITLPFVDKQASLAPKASSEISEKEPQALKILWVDDEEPLRKMGKRVLTSLGQQVTVAASATEAIALLETDDFDLMITDVGMPGMNGYDLIKSIRGVYPDLAIVVLTGWGQTITDEKKEDLNILHILGKPVETAQFKEIIKQVIQQKTSKSSEQGE